MSFDTNPVFRKIIVPWYETKKVCWFLICSMTLVMLFAFSGLTVAKGNPDYSGFIWVPVLLIVMAGLVLVSSIRQLLSFYID
jgi:hypothetical protein